MTMLLMNSDEISWVYRCPQITQTLFGGGVSLCQVFHFGPKMSTRYSRRTGATYLIQTRSYGFVIFFLIVMSIRCVLASQQQLKEDGMYLYYWWGPSVSLFIFAFNPDILFHHWLCQKKGRKSSKGLRLNSSKEKEVLLTAGLCS